MFLFFGVFPEKTISTYSRESVYVPERFFFLRTCIRSLNPTEINIDVFIKRFFKVAKQIVAQVILFA